MGTSPVCKWVRGREGKRERPENMSTESKVIKQVGERHRESKQRMYTTERLQGSVEEHNSPIINPQCTEFLSFSRSRKRTHKGAASPQFCTAVSIWGKESRGQITRAGLVYSDMHDRLKHEHVISIFPKMLWKMQKKSWKNLHYPLNYLNISHIV